jgi:hypothetical protein
MSSQAGPQVRDLHVDVKYPPACRREDRSGEGPGRSSRSFVAEGRLDAILDVILPDDVLLVQFGHNDQKPDPVGTFFTRHRRAAWTLDSLPRWGIS